MPESFTTKLERIKFNFFPAYRGSGARVVYIADDYREIRVKIPLSWRTRNYDGNYSNRLEPFSRPQNRLLNYKNEWFFKTRVHFRYGRHTR